MLDLLHCVAANGASGDTGFPPSSREAAAYGLEAFLLRPDASTVGQVLAGSGLHVQMFDAILGLLNGKLHRIRAHYPFEARTLVARAAAWVACAVTSQQQLPDTPRPCARRSPTDACHATVSAEAAGIRCYVALHKMDGELGAHLKNEIHGAVTPPVLKKLEKAVADEAVADETVADETVATDDADGSV